MMRMAMLAGAVVALAGPAMAQGACVRPTAPAPVDGSTATMEQLLGAKTQTSAFIAASDAFQTCVIDDLTAQRAAAKTNKTKVPSETVKAADALISANQADKERVGTEFNTAVKAYKAAHPS